MPEEVVTSPEGPGTELHGIRTDRRQGTKGVEIGAEPARWRRPGKRDVLGKGRQNESDRPNGGGGSLHDHSRWYTPSGASRANGPTIAVTPSDGFGSVEGLATAVATVW